MKITVKQVIQLWNALNAIYKVNDVLPSIFDYHIKRNLKILQEEVKTLQQLDEKETAKIHDEEIELNLTKVTPQQLPEKMPNGVLELFKPLLIEQEQKEHKSAIEKLLTKNDKSKNGQKEKTDSKV